MPALTTAQGYLDLGMFDDAWAATEDLPPEARTQPAVLEIRLRILTAMEKWELGDAIAQVLIHSEDEPERCRETVARFRHAFARALCAQDEVDSAKEQVPAGCGCLGANPGGDRRGRRT